MYQQMQASKAEGESNAAIAEYNAKISDQNAAIQKSAATDALQRGAGDAATIKQNARALNAKARAMQGASGVELGTGSALDIISQNTATGELDSLTALNNAQREAYGFEINALSAKNDATANRFAGENARLVSSYKSTASMAGMGSTLVSGFGNAYKQSKSSGSWWSY
jgi:hypothetical protein